MLNVTDDHLDRYAGLDDYAATKAAVFAGGGVQVLNRDDARVKAMALAGRRVFTFGLDAPAGPDDFGVGVEAGTEWLARGGERLLQRSELQLTGNHNVANALAVLALCEAAGLPRDGLERHPQGLPRPAAPGREGGRAGRRRQLLRHRRS